MIYTFYSFKGGVGRSMALANIAECFYLKGLRVVMLDWDLEAPGLESYFFERPTTPATSPALQGIDLVQSRLGLIDLLTEYKRSFPVLAPAPVAPIGEWGPKSFRERIAEELNATLQQPADFWAHLDEHLSLSTYLFPIHSPQPNAAAGPTAGLWLLPAGWRHKERFEAYAEAVQAFDWEDFYISFRGKEFFDWMRARLLQQADVVLVDSRTGVTEMGGVCTRQLADVVVSFCAPNGQNLEGVAKMVKSFKRPATLEARDHRPLQTVVVPTRVDPQEVQKLKEFLKRFDDTVEESTHAPDIFLEVGSRYFDLSVPYRTIYSYEERRVIGEGITDLDPTRGLEIAYRKIADHLALLAPEGSVIRQRFATELQQQFPALLPKVAMWGDGDSQVQARELRALLSASGIGVWPTETTTDASRWNELLPHAIHVVIVTSEQPDLSPLRQTVRLAAQLGRWIHVVGPAPGWRPPAWLQRARIYSNERQSELIESLRTSKPGVRSPQMAPPLPAGYVARSELVQRVKRLLLGASSGRPCFALWGEAGTGKTTLAAAVAADEEVVDAYPDGVLWLNANDPSSLSQLFSALTGDAASSDVPMARLNELLRHRRSLLVIDEAWALGDLSRLLEIGDQATRLVLTRNLNVASTVAQEVVSVSAMTPEEAGALLTGTPQPVELTEKLGNSPLAISLAKSALEELLASQQTLPDALGTLEEKVARHGIVAFDRLVDATTGAQPNEASSARNQSVATSVEATLSQLAGWQRRRLHQLVEECGASMVPFDRVFSAWTRRGKEAGEPYPFEGRERTRLLQLYAGLGLIELGKTAAGGGRSRSEVEAIQLRPMYRRLLEAQGVIGARVTRSVKPHVSSAGDRRSNTDIDLVKRILAGQATSFPEALALFKRLKAARYFGYARQLMTRIRRMPGATNPRYLAQQLALCTYKDADLASQQRFERALDTLDEADPLANSTDQETLGLAGAVFKYRWRSDGQIADLERSAAYYLRGYALGIENDFGYTAINAAFVLDLLAAQEDASARKAGAQALTAENRRELATRIRGEIADQLPNLAKEPGREGVDKQWWFLVTLAEALFGLGRHEQARFMLREALATEVVEWEFETTARQLAELAWLQNGGAPPEQGSAAATTLQVFLGHDAPAVESVITGKVGLALSGGGFRASLFHVGVLARLAELDLLRRVEVLSCVSGGSIIGAHYYLEVRDLHQSKSDDEITQQDYIDLVKRVERDFLAGVQRNLRVRLFANPWVSLRCLLSRQYTRTDRLGELFERHLFSRVGGRGETKWWLNDLTIQPKDAADGFSPKLDNWRRRNKVPILILNATTLNTGHNWQFTATWMGEPPAGVGSEVDSNDLLRRMYYWEAPRGYRSMRLGRAVVASACVPGLFEPIEMAKMFPARRVRLVDGGVHDNQGVAGLLEQECTALLVSDASGQMESQYSPGAGRFQALRRSSAIAMARVRESEFRDLDARFRSSQLRGLQYLHLKKGLEVDPIDWVDCPDPYDVSADAKPVEARGPLTAYGMPKTIQARLAAVRTDLDSFSDQEAFALMYSGYRMAGARVQECLPGLTLPSSTPSVDWRFLTIEKTITKAKDHEDAHDDLNRLLAVGHSNALRVWRLRGWHWLLPLLLIATIAIVAPRAGGQVVEALLESAYIAVYVLLLGAEVSILALGLYVLVCGGLRLAGWRRPFTRIPSSLFMSTVGWIPWAFHQHIVDPLFLDRGAAPDVPAKKRLTHIWKPIAFAVALVAATTTVLVGDARERRNEELARARTRTEAFAYLAKSDWQQAVVALDRVVESDENDVEARLGRAWANRELGQYPQAIADYTVAMDRTLPDDMRVKALLDRAWAYQLNGNASQAGADKNNALAVKLPLPSDGSLQQLPKRTLEAVTAQQRAWAYDYLAQRRWDRAVAAWNVVIAADANDVDARLGRAFAYRELGQLPAAIDDYTAAIGQPISGAQRVQALRDRARAYRLNKELPQQQTDEKAADEEEAKLNPDVKRRVRETAQAPRASVTKPRSGATD